MIIPLGDASRRPMNFPVITLLIIVVNLGVFVLELIKGDAFVSRWALVPANVTAGHDYITILSAIFMHASWSHIIGNMIFLWAFGPEIEDAMGPGRYLVFYLLGGFVAMLTQIAGAPHSTVPNLGASGAIAAVMGAFLITFPGDRIRSVLFIFVFFTVTYISAALLIGIWFLIQVFSVGSIFSAPQAGGVAYLAHVGGLIYGVAFARLFENRERLAGELNEPY